MLEDGNRPDNKKETINPLHPDINMHAPHTDKCWQGECV